MRIVTTLLAGSVIALAGITGAQASVIYNWQPVSDGPELQTLGGTVAITDAAFASGTVKKSLFLSYSSQPDSTRFADSPIEGVSLQVFSDSANAEQRNFDIFTNPTQDQSANPLLYDLNASLSVLDNMLFGSLDLLTNMDQFSMTAGTDGLWTIHDFGSDALLNHLSGATGRWVLDASSIDVPAPGAWSLFALAALAGLGLARRRSA